MGLAWREGTRLGFAAPVPRYADFGIKASTRAAMRFTIASAPPEMPSLAAPAVLW